MRRLFPRITQSERGVPHNRRAGEGKAGGPHFGEREEDMFATKKGASSAHNPSHLLPSEVMDKCIGSKLWVS